MPLSEKTIIGKVVLNVENIDNMKNFYTSIIGLELKNETEQIVQLGAFDDEQVLLELKPVVPCCTIWRKASCYWVIPYGLFIANS
ncbi:VOC family protein [Carnobacterium sp. FSL W8-0810]|uniref:VOC family protein n=1 Tax=Carnobacterium sp. FSL W8-0810 TaxID=2954705 RepID=UPI0030F91F06